MYLVSLYSISMLLVGSQICNGLRSLVNNAVQIPIIDQVATANQYEAY